MHVMHNGSMNRGRIVHDINDQDNSRVMFPMQLQKLEK